MTRPLPPTMIVDQDGKAKVYDPAVDAPPAPGDIQLKVTLDPHIGQVVRTKAMKFITGVIQEVSTMTRAGKVLNTMEGRKEKQEQEILNHSRYDVLVDPQDVNRVVNQLVAWSSNDGLSSGVQKDCSKAAKALEKAGKAYIKAWDAAMDARDDVWSEGIHGK